jgi:porin
MHASLLAPVLLCLAASAPAQPDDPALAPAERDASAHPTEPEPRPYWHLPRKRDWGFHIDPPDQGEPDWNPLSGPAQALKGALHDKGFRLDLDTALYDQHASDRATGDENLGTFAWQSVGDWQLLDSKRLGSSYLQFALLGSPGLNYDSDDRSMSSNVGSISGLNANVFPDPAALDELFFKHVSPGGRLIVVAGRVDQSFYFDTNRVANNGFRQFFAFALENNLSIPFSTYGGTGALVRFEPSKNLYLMGAVTTAENDEPWAFWQSADDGDWGELFEIGLTLRLPHLGKGHYRITPWHSHLSGSDGWGLGVNLDQELGLDWLVAFFRFGIGDDDVTPVERFVSGGLALERPFGRKHDLVSVGAAWSDPSPEAGSRDETLLELFYRLELSPSIALTPDLQIVFDPANNPNNDTILIGGVRLEMRF